MRLTCGPKCRPTTSKHKSYLAPGTPLYCEAQVAAVLCYIAPRLLPQGVAPRLRSTDYIGNLGRPTTVKHI
eukprot:8362548-Pyramimonas_sp.AAC.1